MGVSTTTLAEAWMSRDESEAEVVKLNIMVDKACKVIEHDVDRTQDREAHAPVQVLEGTRLTVARRRRGLSQSELAAKIGVAEKTLRAWEEKQEWCEDKEIILKLAWALKFPVGFFTGPEIELLDPKRISFRR